MNVNLDNQLIRWIYPAKKFHFPSFVLYVALFAIEILLVVAFIVIYGSSVSAGDLERMQAYNWISTLLTDWTFGYFFFLLGSHIGYKQAQRDAA